MSTPSAQHGDILTGGTIAVRYSDGNEVAVQGFWQTDAQMAAFNAGLTASGQNAYNNYEVLYSFPGTNGIGAQLLAITTSPVFQDKAWRIVRTTSAGGYSIVRSRRSDDIHPMTFGLSVSDYEPGQLYFVMLDM